MEDYQSPPSLSPILQQLLQQYPDGISEYDLLRCLADEPYHLFEPKQLSDSLGLFQWHFILFNGLYQLRDEWLATRQADLAIDCFCIRRLPWQSGQAGLQHHDKLRAYYLNWQHFNETAQGDVDALLNGFWQRLAGWQQPVDSQQRDEALAILQLSDGVNHRELKQQYRRLLHQHHPDKGGDNEQLKRIKWAYELLTGADVSL